MDIINSLLVSSLARTMLPCDLRGYAFLCKMSGCQNVIPKDCISHPTVSNNFEELLIEYSIEYDCHHVL